MLIRKALVIDNIDIDQQDKIKVKVLPEMQDVTDDLLPYIYPLFGSNGSKIKRDIPKKDDYVYVIIFDDTWKHTNMKYIPNCDVRIKNDYTKFDTLKSKITDIQSAYTYPEPCILNIYNDDSTDFINVTTGERAIFQKDSYILIDSLGKIFINGKTNNIKFYNNNASIELDNQGNISIENLTGCSLSVDNNLVDIKNSVSDMRKELEYIWSSLISLNTNLQSWVSTNAVIGSPVTPNPATLSLFIADNVQNNIRKNALQGFLK